MGGNMKGTTVRIHHGQRLRRLRLWAGTIFAVAIVFSTVSQASAAVSVTAASSEPDYNCPAGWSSGFSSSAETYAKGCINAVEILA